MLGIEEIEANDNKLNKLKIKIADLHLNNKK